VASSILSAPLTRAVTPEWVQDAVFYQIFPDRFARSSRAPTGVNLESWNSPPTTYGFKGGDLDGIIEHLDYLEDLGVTALYLNPIFRSTANHRYHTHDYYQVDPLLGGNGAFDRLLVAAHRAGMRVILDGVFNHASRGFYQFSSILENGDSSPYRDWFHVYSWPPNPYGPGDPGYDSWWGHPALPKFNTASFEVREFLWDVGQYWIERGIDGWRLDVPNEIDDDAFWQEFRRRVKAANGDAYIVGEIWGDAARWLQGDQFDAVMNYPLTRACLGFFAGQTLNRNALDAGGLEGIEMLDGGSFAAEIATLLARYVPEITRSQLNLLGSHDTPRALTSAGGDESAIRLALLFLMTYPGAPCIYYGDEIGMTGGPDPGCRGSFHWDPAGWNESLRAYVKQCVALRHTYPALRRGTFENFVVGGNLYAFIRTLGDTRAIVAFNVGPERVQWSLPAGAWRQVLGTDLTAEGTTSQLPPRSGVVLVDETWSN